MISAARRAVAMSAIAGLALGAGVIGAPVAATQETEPGVNVAVANSSLIDFGRTGSITVHKSTAPQGADGTGNPVDEAPTPVLEGVTFQLYEVKKIEDAADFQEAAGKKITDVDFTTATKVGEGKETAADGTVPWEDLPVGLYVVRETHAPAGYYKVEPFLIFIPMTNPDNTSEWNYDVHAYPKNSESTEQKTVKDADVHVGGEIEYTITPDIPVVTAHAVTKYEVHDQLDADNLRTSAEQISVALSNGTELQQGDDYDYIGT